jgi:hypothetical protein
MVMRVRWQTAIEEVDAPTIEERTVGRDSGEHGRATVRSDADARGSLRSPSRHHSLPVAAHGVADSGPDNLWFSYENGLRVTGHSRPVNQRTSK